MLFSSIMASAPALPTMILDVGLMALLVVVAFAIAVSYTHLTLPTIYSV